MVKESKDSSSSSSNLETESYLEEQESSFEVDSIEQMTTKPKNMRYIMADDRLFNHQKQANYVRQQPYQKIFQQLNGNSNVPGLSHSQFFIENNYMNRALNYYNQPEQMTQRLIPQQLPQSQQTFHQYPFPYRQNIQFSAFAKQHQRQSGFVSYNRYNIQQQQHTMLNNSKSQPVPYTVTTRVVEAGQAQSVPMPGYLPNTDRRLFLVDSYGSKYDLNQFRTSTTKTGIENCKEAFYTNPAFEHSQQNINLSHLSQQDDQSPDLEPRNFNELEITSTISSKSHTEEFSGPVSSSWNITGGIGNSNFPAGKYYREADADEENAFYPIGFERRENSKYLTLHKSPSTFQKFIRHRAFKITLLIFFFLLIGSIVLEILLGAVFPQTFIAARVKIENQANETTDFLETLQGKNNTERKTLFKSLTLLKSPNTTDKKDAFTLYASNTNFTTISPEITTTSTTSFSTTSASTTVISTASLSRTTPSDTTADGTTTSSTSTSNITVLNSNRPRMMVPTFKNKLTDTNELLIELELSTN